MELGARLKEARNAKGMSLEEVQASTKIQKRYLQAIEDNNFDTLPGKFYTRAFIREYASTVGLNPEEVMEEHRSELPSMDEETTIPYTRVQKAKRDSPKQKSSGKPSKLFPAIITVALVVIIAFVIYFFTQQLSTPAETGPETEEPQDEVVISNEEETSGEEGNQEQGSEEDTAEKNQQGTSDESGTSEEQQQEKDEEVTEEKPEEKQQAEVQLQQTGSGGFPEHIYQVTGAKEKQLSVELTGESYLEVTAPKNGENLIDPIIYTAADSPLTIDVSSHNQVFLKTGSAGALTVSVDGQPLEFPADLTTQKLLINFK